MRSGSNFFLPVHVSDHPHVPPVSHISENQPVLVISITDMKVLKDPERA